MGKTHFTVEDLKGMPARHATFVGVDSDGCVFDTMDVKQRQHFHPLIVKVWGLQKIERQVREAAAFVNLHSRWRGRNRFSALLTLFEFLEEWDEVRAAGAPLPGLAGLRAYCRSGLPLGNPSLRDEAARTGDPDLARVLEWSLAVNRDIDRHMRPVPPFAGARRCLAKMHATSDLLVVSQTPEQALLKEWRQHGLDHLVHAIAGQELGTKSEHIALAAGGKYAPGRLLMVGDAPGDLTAARDNGAAFYPILPGREEEAWQRLHDEAYDLFVRGRYGGDYEARLVREFDDLLPGTPPWKKSPG
jgi:phosphoglycolate phosphatase-like HAD superfamily hydrolase